MLQFSAQDFVSICIATVYEMKIKYITMDDSRILTKYECELNIFYKKSKQLNAGQWTVH